MKSWTTYCWVTTHRQLDSACNKLASTLQSSAMSTWRSTHNIKHRQSDIKMQHDTNSLVRNVDLLQLALRLGGFYALLKKYRQQHVKCICNPEQPLTVHFCLRWSASGTQTFPSDKASELLHKPVPRKIRPHECEEKCTPPVLICIALSEAIRWMRH